MSRADALARAMAQIATLIAVAKAIEIGALKDGLEQSDIGDTFQLRDIVRAVIEFRQHLDKIQGGTP